MPSRRNDTADALSGYTKGEWGVVIHRAGSSVGRGKMGKSDEVPVGHDDDGDAMARPIHGDEQWADLDRLATPTLARRGGSKTQEATL